MKPCEICGEIRPNCYCHEETIPLIVPLILCAAFWTVALFTGLTVYSITR